MPDRRDMEHSGIITFRGSDHAVVLRRDSQVTATSGDAKSWSPLGSQRRIPGVAISGLPKKIWLPGSYQAWAYSGAP